MINLYFKKYKNNDILTKKFKYLEDDFLDHLKFLTMTQ